MNIGMLWFDNDVKTEFNSKVDRAALYYQEKYGKNPNVCFVHPSMLKAQIDSSPKKELFYRDIEIRTSKSVLPNHFWIGINGTKTPVGT